jgi:hypothetical protein
VLAVGAEVLLDLRRELARRRDDEGAHGVAGGGVGRRRFPPQILEDR